MNRKLQKIKSIFVPQKSHLPFPTIDVHTHILPGVDDGFTRIEDSVEALRCLQAHGVKEVVLTPHMHPGVFPDNNENRLRTAYSSFLSHIPSDVSIKTSMAAEYMIVDGFEDRSDDHDLLTFPDGSILVEMSYAYKSRNLEETLFNLVMAGKKPILAHPERYGYLADNLRVFDSLIDRGCSFQLNILSVTGLYGSESMKILRYLLERDMYRYVASDLHSLQQLQYMLDSRIDKTLAEKVSALCR